MLTCSREGYSLYIPENLSPSLNPASVLFLLFSMEYLFRNIHRLTRAFMVYGPIEKLKKKLLFQFFFQKSKVVWNNHKTSGTLNSRFCDTASWQFLLALLWEKEMLWPIWLFLKIAKSLLFPLVTTNLAPDHNGAGKKVLGDSEEQMRRKRILLVWIIGSAIWHWEKR